MLKFLIKKFIKDPENVSDATVRSAYGTLCGAYGVFLNILLFLGKLLAGMLSGSVAITADAFNNLSDAGSSIITLLGFRLASKKPDPKHPFGHGRIEYFAGLTLSIIIIIIGIELGHSSVHKIQSPEEIIPGIIPAIILILSILVKIYIAHYNTVLGQKINSAAMKATAADSISDSISTIVVLLSMIVFYLFGINIDGWAGLVVAVFVGYTGFRSALDTISPLLGEAPDPELVNGIRDTVMAHNEILDIHDLIVHNYGPGRLIASLHAEVDGKRDFFEAHDVIDNIETEIHEKYNCLMTIHLDPVVTDNVEIDRLKSEIYNELKQNIHPDIMIHDFRIVSGPTHTNVLFDAVIPHSMKIDDSEAKQMITDLIAANHPNFFAKVNIDRSFV